MSSRQKRKSRSKSVEKQEPVQEEKVVEQVEEKPEKKIEKTQPKIENTTEVADLKSHMRLTKSAKLKSDTFLHLIGRDLYLDSSDSTEFFTLSHVDITHNVLDFSVDEEGVIRIFTTTGDAIQVTLDSRNKKLSKPKSKQQNYPTLASYEQNFYNASIFRHQILAIIEGEWRAVLLDFNGNVLQQYEDIPKKVRFCIFTSQLKAIADSSIIYVKKSGETEWHKYKDRRLFTTNLIHVNRQTEFAVVTKTVTRIFRKQYQIAFRPWAKETVALLQCPCRKHFYAHLDSSGLLRIGDNEEEYAIQENDVTGICWDMGMLWARNREGKWRKICLSFDDQLFDMRVSKLSGLEITPEVQESGNVIDVIERIIETPATSMEIMKVLPPIAQRLRKSRVINEAISSLDTYISKSGQIEELLGQIDLVLPQQKIEE